MPRARRRLRREPLRRLTPDTTVLSWRSISLLVAPPARRTWPTAKRRTSVRHVWKAASACPGLTLSGTDSASVPWRSSSARRRGSAGCGWRAGDCSIKSTGMTSSAARSIGSSKRRATCRLRSSMACYSPPGRSALADAQALASRAPAAVAPSGRLRARPGGTRRGAWQELPTVSANASSRTWRSEPRAQPPAHRAFVARGVRPGQRFAAVGFLRGRRRPGASPRPPSSGFRSPRRAVPSAHRPDRVGHGVEDRRLSCARKPS